MSVRTGAPTASLEVGVPAGLPIESDSGAAARSEEVTSSSTSENRTGRRWFIAESPDSSDCRGLSFPARYCSHTDDFFAHALCPKRSRNATAVAPRCEGSFVPLYFDTPSQYVASGARSDDSRSEER